MPGNSNSSAEGAECRKNTIEIEIVLEIFDRNCNVETQWKQNKNSIEMQWKLHRNGR